MTALLEETSRAVSEAARRPRPKQKYADFADIDTDFVLAHLRAAFPGYGDEVLGTFIGWTIHWDYLR